ncbi:MAG: helix-turn-helix transcriptional regulator [Planctomycetes bacterium]|nr:helix-turn-helix transcriptional regulator [Planctomycetota bacterium]
MDPERIAKALADGQRLQILQRIAEHGEICCGEVCEGFDIAQATVSHHLKELLAADLVERRKQGQHAYFRFRPETLRGYLEQLQQRLGVSAFGMLAAQPQPVVASTQPDLTKPIPSSANPRS